MKRGLQLFNRAEFFDAHEVLEDVWREAPAGTARRHLQGLVQLAVAFHHASRENHVGARSVLDRAMRNLEGAEATLPLVDLARLRAELAEWQRYLAGAETLAGGASRPALPRIHFVRRAEP
jgi:predicted metal-dependent hydrolase